MGSFPFVVGESGYQTAIAQNSTRLLPFASRKIWVLFLMSQQFLLLLLTNEVHQNDFIVLKLTSEVTHFGWKPFELGSN